MSFHFILPSNVSPEIFPTNSGSKYSTPIQDSISLAGRWEIALIGVTCSNCINTFNNDIITIEEKEYKRNIKLEPQSFRNVDKAISYVNKCIANDHVNFTVVTENRVTLTLKNKDVAVRFGDTLRDIFSFTKNYYSGVGEYTTEDEFSLTRRIDYLYIYSNVSEYVRVGDTKTPLLGIVTFNPGKECNKLSEHLFDNPTYVSLIQNNISEITIGIFDDAGEMIPFEDGATTVICLHFRHVE